MKYSYYPGCSLHCMSVEYHDSTVDVLGRLGVELEELEDWSCCGATPAHATSEYLALALPLRNLILAEKRGYDVLLPCAACYNVFRMADHEIKSGNQKAMRVNQQLEGIMGCGYRGGLNIRHVLEVMARRPMLDEIAKRVVVPLEGLRLVTYYGCLLTRPPEVVAFDNPEQPRLMDELLVRLGARVMRWSYKTDCCGASLAASRSELVAELCSRIVEAAREAGAELIATACPLCQTNLDTRQDAAKGRMPVLFFTELVGIAMGSRAWRDWLPKHLNDPQPLLRSLKLIS